MSDEKQSQKEFDELQKEYEKFLKRHKEWCNGMVWKLMLMSVAWAILMLYTLIQVFRAAYG